MRAGDFKDKEESNKEKEQNMHRMKKGQNGMKASTIDVGGGTTRVKLHCKEKTETYKD